jgi:ParB-like chromosome segregation protein Spo0J
MERFGVTAPVLVDEDGVLIYGHGRLRAAKLLGYTELPVSVARGWSEDEKKAYRLADNQLSLNSEWNMPLLKAEISELSLSGFNLSLTGFQEGQLTEFISGLGAATERGWKISLQTHKYLGVR